MKSGRSLHHLKKSRPPPDDLLNTLQQFPTIVWTNLTKAQNEPSSEKLRVVRVCAYVWVFPGQCVNIVLVKHALVSLSLREWTDYVKRQKSRRHSNSRSDNGWVQRSSNLSAAPRSVNNWQTPKNCPNVLQRLNVLKTVQDLPVVNDGAHNSKF